MTKIVGRVIIVGLFVLVSSFAQAKARILGVEDGDAFDFQVISECRGCVGFTGFEGRAPFPDLPEGRAEALRFYYSSVSATSVNESSPYVEVFLDCEPHNSCSIPGARLGNWSSGRTYYFKVGLADDRGNLIYMTPDRSFDPRRHSVIIR